jgi:hypothetical protein
MMELNKEDKDKLVMLEKLGIISGVDNLLS